MDKDLLLKARLPEAEVEVPGVGTVRVRALNLNEADRVSQVKNTDARVRRILALGMVDPVLTEAEAGRWQRNAPAGEVDKVSTKIAELSGILPESAKDAVKTFRGEPGSGVPILPGAEVGDDGSDPPVDDEQ